VLALLAFGFGQLGLHRVWAFCLAENKASWRVMERAGLRREGVLRNNVRLQRRWWDTAVYAILEGEWAHQRNDVVGRLSAPYTG
jgi:RimJ/RimL family protein N-acetyltransferase